MARDPVICAPRGRGPVPSDRPHNPITLCFRASLPQHPFPRAREESLCPIVKALQALVFEVDPDACEVVRHGDRAATYGVGSRKIIDGYAYILPYRKWVNLGFYQGVDLADPESLLEGTGAKMRHVKVRSLEAAGSSAIRQFER